MVMGTAVSEKLATSYDTLARAARVPFFSSLADQESMDSDIHQALRYKKAIDENNGLLPRLEVLRAKGVFLPSTP